MKILSLILLSMSLSAFAQVDMHTTGEATSRWILDGDFDAPIPNGTYQIINTSYEIRGEIARDMYLAMNDVPVVKSGSTWSRSGRQMNCFSDTVNYFCRFKLSPKGKFTSPK